MLNDLSWHRQLILDWKVEWTFFLGGPSIVLVVSNTPSQQGRCWYPTKPVAQPTNPPIQAAQILQEQGLKSKPISQLLGVNFFAWGFGSGAEIFIFGYILLYKLICGICSMALLQSRGKMIRHSKMNKNKWPMFFLFFGSAPSTLHDQTYQFLWMKCHKDLSGSQVVRQIPPIPCCQRLQTAEKGTKDLGLRREAQRAEVGFGNLDHFMNHEAKLLVGPFHHSQRTLLWTMKKNMSKHMKAFDCTCTFLQLGTGHFCTAYCCIFWCRWPWLNVALLSLALPSLASLSLTCPCLSWLDLQSAWVSFA